MKTKSVELIRDAIKNVVSGCKSRVFSSDWNVKRCDETIKDGRSQGARTRATNERAGCVEDLTKKEAEHAEAVEALREFNEEHPS